MALPLRPGVGGTPAEAATPEPLDPASIDKYATSLVIPPAMPRTSRLSRGGRRDVDYYEIAVRQFDQQILPPGHATDDRVELRLDEPPGLVQLPGVHDRGEVPRPVRVKWINELVDGSGNFLPHLLPVDPTLHWANPPGRRERQGHDARRSPGRRARTRARCRSSPTCTAGTNHEESDGYPEAWYLPAARNIPAGFASVGKQVREVQGASSASARGRSGSPARRCSSTPTTSAPPRCGTTTTPWA